MKLWEKIVKEEGQQMLDLIVMVYVNFYYAELEIIEVCEKWIPRRTNLEEKFMLLDHAADEIRHSSYFKQGVEYLGLNWDDLPHEKYGSGHDSVGKKELKKQHI